LSGIAFGYFFMVPMILEFLYAIPDPDLMVQAYRLQDYFSIFLMFTFALALIFQLPIVMLGVGSLGLVTPKFFRKYRRHFILVAFVVGAMLTPPEPFSQLLMATPTVLLYELGIILMTISHKSRSKAKSKAESKASDDSKSQAPSVGESADPAEPSDKS
jgi:sec-independent protein translocase protein TatC